MATEERKGRRQKLQRAAVKGKKGYDERHLQCEVWYCVGWDCGR